MFTSFRAMMGAAGVVEEDTDDRVYIKNTALGSLAAATSYEAVNDTDGYTTGNYYLIELSTMKIFNSNKSGSLYVEYYHCAYLCDYVSTVGSIWTLGSEVTGLNRPDTLYGPENAVGGAVVWNLT